MSLTPFQAARDEAAEKYREQCPHPEAWSTFRAGADLGFKYAMESEAVRDMAALINHALGLGHLGEGSTRTWAKKCLAAFEQGRGG